jgi:hypothetical protein
MTEKRGRNDGRRMDSRLRGNDGEIGGRDVVFVLPHQENLSGARRDEGEKIFRV